MPTDHERRAQERLEKRLRRLEEGLRRREEHVRRREEHLREHLERHRARLEVRDDGETRRRLLEVAAELFAEDGLDGVSVREICREAGANVAAINYHFGDKLGLYTEVVKMAVERMGERFATAARPPEGTAEEQLGWLIRAQLERVMSERGRARDAGLKDDSWVHRLMRHEMERPTTPALDRMIREAFRPQFENVSRIVAELMGCPTDDPRVGTAVANIHGLPVLLAHRVVVSRLVPAWKLNSESLQVLAEQSIRYALAGVRALAESGPAKGSR